MTNTDDWMGLCPLVSESQFTKALGEIKSLPPAGGTVRQHCLSVAVCVSAYPSVRLCLCLSVCLSVGRPVGRSVGLHEFIYVRPSIYVYLYLYVRYGCVFRPESIYLSTSVCLHRSTSVYPAASICVCGCTILRDCLFVCLSVCVCLSM